MPDQLAELVRQLHLLVPRLIELVTLLAWMSNPAHYVESAIPVLVQPLQSFFDGYLFSTKDSIGGGDFTHSPAITRLEPYIAGIADAGLGAALVWGCYHMMWSHSVRNLYTVRHLLPRALLASLLINFALPLFQALVDFENVLCRGIREIPLGFSWTGNLWALVQSNDPGGVPVLTLLTMAALLAGYAVLACAYAIRYALLILLAVTAPLAALLFILPDTHHWAREWGSLLISTLLMQPLQLLILAVGFQLENDVARTSQAPIRHLFALGCLLIAFKVPGALHTTSQVGTRAMAGAKHYAQLALHPRHVA